MQSTPRIAVIESPATAPAAAVLRARGLGGLDPAEADGLVLPADALDPARAALAAGRAVMLCGRPNAPLPAAGEGVLVVADPPWLRVAGAGDHSATVDGWEAACWAFVAALVAHRRPPEATPRADGATVHPTAVIDGDVTLGPGTKVWHFSKLLGPLTIGAGCSLGQNVVVERGVRIGDNVRIQNNVSVYSGVILEDDVFCGPSMVFTNIGTPRSHHPRKGSYAPTRVGRGASIGANATVVCGRTLGPYCFVGAGAVVTRDVPAYGLVYGNPARLRGWACYCGARLPLGVDPAARERADCAECGRSYRREGHAVCEESQG